MARKSLEDIVGSPFVMVPLQRDSIALKAYRERELLPRDLALLFVLIHHIHPITGRIWMTAAEMAEVMGRSSYGRVIESLARLKKADLVARGYDKWSKKRWFYCVNPFFVACSGGSRVRQQQVAQFLAASELPSRRRGARAEVSQSDPLLDREAVEAFLAPEPQAA